MNCRPGDLAVIVTVPREIKPASLRPVVEQHAIGRIVRCVSMAQANDGSPAWRIEQAFDIPWRGGSFTVFGICDRCLRPIRDSGEEAVDEMVQRVGPAPMTLTEILQGVAHG